MDQKRKLLQLIGLAVRAGKVVSGSDLVLKAIQNQQVQLVFLAADASENTKKKFKDKTSFYEVALDCSLSKEELTQATGKNRTLVAIKDKGFAKSMKELIGM